MLADANTEADFLAACAAANDLGGGLAHLVHFLAACAAAN